MNLDILLEGIIKHAKIRREILKLAKCIKKNYKSNLTECEAILKQLISDQFGIDPKYIKLKIAKGKSKFNEFPNAAISFSPIIKKGTGELKFKKQTDSNGNVYIEAHMKITLLINEKLIELLNTKELAAVIAHEIGHLYHYEKISKQIKTMIITAISGLLGLRLAIVGTIVVISGGSTILPYIGALLLLIALASLKLTSIYSVSSEHAADSFAAEIGYKNELISALEKIKKYKTQYNIKVGLLQRIIYKLFPSHPETTDRINKIKKQVFNLLK